MPKLLLLPLCGAAAAASLSAQVTLTHLGQIDVANAVSGVGNNIAAVAWNGVDLYVAGYNGSTTAQNVALNKLAGALSLAPVWGVPFGVQTAVPAQRGYINLDLDPATGQLRAGFDPGAANPQGITAWDGNGNLLWSKNARGSSGVAFDPGFPGGSPALGRGTGWAGFGQPGRALQDDATGADVWTLANGMDIRVIGESTFFRDMDFDPATGDVYVRAGNELYKGTRTGDNTCVTTHLVDLPSSATINNINLQNVCFVDAPTGSVVLFNDRNFGGPGQVWQTVIQAVRPDGTRDTIDWGTFAPATGAGAYDFSFDRATSTLAILDYWTRKVEMFAVAVNPTYAYGQGCSGTSTFAPQLRGSGAISGAAGGTIVYDLTSMPPLSLALLAFGFDDTQIPLTPGCDILVDPILPFYLGPFVTGPGALGSGAATAQLTLPAGWPGLNITAQGVVLEGGNGSALIVSNGVRLIIP